MTLAFNAISLDHYRPYEDLLAVCPQKTSDYSFVNLWGWAEEYGLQWAWQDRLVWLKQTIPDEVCWAPIGPWETIAWEGALSGAFFRETAFVRVPEKLTELWKSQLPDRIRIAETRGHWDYLYDVAELADLKGNRFHKKKNLLNQFCKKYDYRYISLSSDQIEQAISLQTDWCTWRDCESMETLAAENRSIQRVLTHWSDLAELLGGALLVNGQMVAYTVAEPLSEKMLVVHFEKADPDFKGAYQAINQMFLAHHRENFNRVNREQDLDDEGLRKAKLSYHPIEFLRKYRVTVL